MKINRVVITGIGVIAPNGVGREKFWDACLSGEGVAVPVPEIWKRWGTTVSTIWAPLPSVDFKEYALDRVEILQMDMCTRMACATTQMALSDAGFDLIPRGGKSSALSIGEADPNRWGVIWGTGAGGVTTLIDSVSTHLTLPVKNRLESLDLAPDDERLTAIRSDLESSSRINPFAVSMYMANSCSARIGIKYSINGANTTISTACAAGTVAIGHAFEAVRNGALDCMVAGGSEYLGDRYGGIFRFFDIPGVLVKNCDDPAVANRPFDKNRTGFLFSEGGSAAFILENLEHALHRNAPIIAEIATFAESFDAHSIMMIDPSGEQIRRMIATALNNAGLTHQDIDYINSHGTGTELNDEIEASILWDIFGDKPLVNSTKSLIGHTIGASGAIEAAVTALSVRNDTTHVSKNIDDPVNDLSFVREPIKRTIRSALTHSFAFGGHNAGLIIKKYEP